MQQQYFTDEEWATLAEGPAQAIMAVVLADKSDPVSFLKEVRAAVSIITEEAQRQDISSDLVKSLVNSLKEADVKEMVEGDELIWRKVFNLLAQIQTFDSASAGRKAAIAKMQHIGIILASKVTAVQAQEYKDWVLSIGRKVAEAVKEGGFLGIGGERISGDERSTLSELEKALEIRV